LCPSLNLQFAIYCVHFSFLEKELIQRRNTILKTSRYGIALDLPPKLSVQNGLPREVKHWSFLNFE
jgi:hypothetical protein